MLLFLFSISSIVCQAKRAHLTLAGILETFLKAMKNIKKFSLLLAVFLVFAATSSVFAFAHDDIKEIETLLEDVVKTEQDITITLQRKKQTMTIKL